jgi:hypothetical protein
MCERSSHIFVREPELPVLTTAAGVNLVLTVKSERMIPSSSDLDYLLTKHTFNKLGSAEVFAITLTELALGIVAERKDLSTVDEN